MRDPWKFLEVLELEVQRLQYKQLTDEQVPLMFDVPASNKFEADIRQQDKVHAPLGCPTWGKLLLLRRHSSVNYSVVLAADGRSVERYSLVDCS